MRIVFMGTPDFAVPTLDALVAAGHEVVAAYTQPPRPGGRRGRSWYALAGAGARRGAGHRGAARRCRCASAEAQAEFAALGADVAVVAAYGLILPQAVLDAPRHGCLNVHGSLLPRWRGAAPIQRAILAGDAETGRRHHADGGRARYRAGAARGADADRRQDGGRADGRTGGDGRAADGRGAGRPRRASRGGAAGGGRHLCAPRSTRPRRGSISREPPRQVERQVRAFNPPGRVVRDRGRADPQMLAADGRWHPASSDVPTTGTVVDDALTIACGERRDPPHPRPARRARRHDGRRAAARLPDPGRHPAVTRFALTVEYDGRPFMGWQRQAHGPERAGRRSRRRCSR